MSEITTVGLDLAKTVFRVHGVRSRTIAPINVDRAASSFRVQG